MSFIDEQIVSLKFDASDFIDKVQDTKSVLGSLSNTISTFKDDSTTLGDRLRSVLGTVGNVSNTLSKMGVPLASSISGITSGINKIFDKFNGSKNNFDMGNIEIAIDKVKNKFSALETIATGALLTIGNQIVSTGERIAKNLTIDQVAEGWRKYAEIVRSTQVTLATGAGLEQTNDALRQLAWYADETSYSLTDMTSSISKFTSYGIAIEDAAIEIMGIDNAVAKAGGTIQMATSAQQAFQRAFSTGYMSLQIWRRQLTTSGLITEDFKEKCIEAGLALGTLERDSEGVVRAVSNGVEVTATGLEMTLSEAKWMTTEVMEYLLKGYASSTAQIEYIYNNLKGKLTTSEIIDQFGHLFDEYSLAAFKMAQEATTFEQAVESLGDTVSTQWNNVFSNIFGGYKEAKRLWSELANWLIDTVATPVYDLVDLTNEWATTEVKNLEYYSDETRRLITEEKSVVANFRSLFAEGLLNIMKALTSYVNAFKIAWNSVFNSVTAKQLGDLTYKFVDFTEGLILSDEQMQNLAQKIQYVLATVKLVMNVLSALGKYVKDEIWPVVVKVIDIIRDKLSGVSGVFGELYSRFSSFVEGLTGKSNTIMSISEAFKEWKEDMEGATVTEEQVIELINEYNAKYSEMKDNLVDSAKTIDALTGSTKNFAKAFEEIDWANVTVEDINTLNSFVDELEQSDVYMNKAASSSKELEAELAKLKKAGYVTSEDISNLRDIIEKIGIASFDASSQVKALTDKIRNTNWSTATEKDVRELREYTNAIKDSNVFMTDTQKIAKEYKDKLESIGKQGYATAEDISDLNDIVDKLDTSMRKSAESTEIISQALSEIDFSSADKNTADAMQRVSDALKNSSSYMSDASIKSNEFKSKLKDISKQGYVTASDIEDLNNIIKEFNSNVGDANTSTDLINKTLKNLDFTSLGSKTVGEMQNVIEQLKGTSTYLDETAEAGKEFENKLSSIAKQGYVTASDLKALDEMVKTLGGDLKNASESTKITAEALKTMNFDGSAKSVKDMEKVIEKLGKSSSYLDEAAELGAKFESELKAIGEQGNVTASDIATLNDIVDKLNGSMAESSETTRIASAALSKFDFSNAGENTAEQMRYVVTELRKADTYFGSAAEQGKAFQDKLKSIADQGYATASDIRSLNNIIYEMEAATKSATEGWSEVALAMRGASEIYDFSSATSETVSVMDDLISVISKSDGILTEADVATMEFNNELKKLGAQGYITSENIETLREKVQAIKDAMEDASTETTKTQKALKGALELYDFSKMNPEELMSFVNTIEQSTTVISKADVLSQQFTDKIREMSNQSKLSYTDFDDLKNIIYEYALAIDEASIETSDMAYKAQAALEIIDWGKLSSKDLPTLREMVATIQSAGDSADEFNELANQMQERLYDIAQAGHATADDIEFLNNTMKKLNDLQEYNIWLNSDTAAALRAFQSKINSINQKGIVTIEDVEQLQKLYYQLSNTSRYTNKAGQAIEGLQSILNSALNTGSLTADNMSSIASWIDKLGEASLNTMGKNIAKTEEYGKVLDENGKLLNETGRITHGLSEEYDENASKVSNVSDKILEYAENLKLQDKQIEDSSMSLEDMISAYDKLGETTKTSAIALSDLLKAAGYSDDAVKAIAGSSELLAESNNKVNESQEKVNKSKYNSVYADRLQESLNKRKETSTTRAKTTTEKYTTAIDKQVDSTTKLVESVEKAVTSTNKVADKTKDTTDEITKNTSAIIEATTAVEDYDDAQENSNNSTKESKKSLGGIMDMFTELGKILGNTFDFSKLGGNGTGKKDLTSNLKDLLESINLSTFDVGKIALVALIVSNAIKKVLQEFNELGESISASTLDSTAKLFKALGICLIAFASAIAIIVASDWLFGGTGDAIDSLNGLITKTGILIISILLIARKYSSSEVMTSVTVFVAIGILLLEVAATLAIIERFGGSCGDILVAALALIKIVNALNTLVTSLANFASTTSTQHLATAGVLAIMLGTSLLLISSAISLICYINNKYGGALEATIALTIVLSKITSMMATLAIFANGSKNIDFNGLAKSFMAISLLIAAIGVTISAMALLNSKYDLSGEVILSIVALRTVIEQIKDCNRSLIIFSGIYKKADLDGIQKAFVSMSFVILAIGTAIAAISFVDGKYDINNSTKIAKALRTVIEQMKDCIRQLIVISSIFKKANLDGIQKLFFGFASAVGAIGVALSAITFVAGKYDIEKLTPYVKALNKCISHLGSVIRTIILFSNIGQSAAIDASAKLMGALGLAVLATGTALAAIAYIFKDTTEDKITESINSIIVILDELGKTIDEIMIFSLVAGNPDKLDKVAKVLAAISLPILALAGTVALVCWLRNTYPNADLAIEEVTKLMKTIALILVGQGISSVGSINVKILTYSTNSITAIGLCMLELTACIAIILKLYDKYGTEQTEEAIMTVYRMLLLLGLVVVGISAFNKKTVGVSINSNGSSIAKLIKAIGIVCLELSTCIAIINKTAKSAEGDSFDIAVSTVRDCLIGVAIVAAGLIYLANSCGGIDSSRNIEAIAKLIKAISVPLMAMSGAIGALTFIVSVVGDYNALMESAVVVNASIAIISAIAMRMIELSATVKPKVSTFSELQIQLVTITGAMGAVSYAIGKLALITEEAGYGAVWSSYALVMAAISALSLIAFEMTKFSKDLTTKLSDLIPVESMMITLTACVAAITVPIIAVAALCSGETVINGIKIPQIDQASMAIGFGIIFGAMASLTGVAVAIAKFTKSADTASMATASLLFIAMGTALVEMAAACGIIADHFVNGKESGVTRDVIDTVVVLILGLAFTASAILKFSSTADPSAVLAASVLFIAIGASLIEAAYAIKIISETYKAAQDGNVTFETLGTFALVLAGMALVAAVIPTFVASASAPLIMASAVMFAALGLAMMEAAVAIQSICESYNKYGSMVIAACTTAVTVVGLMAVIIGIMAASSGSSLMALASAGSIAIVAASTIALAYAFKELANIKLEQVGTGLLAIGGALAVVVAAGAVGQLCAVGLLAISGAILAIAAAVLLMATAWEKFNKTLTKSVDDIVKESTAGVDKTVDATLSEIEKKTEQATKEANEAFEEVGQQSLEGYEKGMNDKSIADDIEKAAVENMATNPTEAVESELDIHSPSRKFEKIGQYTLEGYYNGINDKSWTEKLKDSASSIGKSILDAFRDVLGIHSPSKEGESDGKNFDAGIKQGIDSDAKSVADSAEKLGKDVDDSANKGLGINGNESSSAKEKGRIYATSLGGGLKDYFNGENLKSFFQDKISSFFSGAVSNVDLSGLTDKLGDSLKFDDLKIDTDSLTKNLQEQLNGMNGSLSLDGAVDPNTLASNVDTSDITAQYQDILNQSMAGIDTQQVANNVDTTSFTNEFASTGVDATNALAQGMVDTSALKNVSDSGSKIKTTTVDSVSGKTGTSINDMIIGVAQKATTSFTKTLESGIPEVKKIGTKILDGLKTGLSDSSIINVISDTSTKIKTKVVGMLTEIQTTLATKSAEIKTVASGLIENLRTHLDFSKIVDSVVASMTKLSGSISSSLSSMGSVMSNGGTEIANAAKTMMDRLNAALNNKSLFNNLGVIGKNIVTGIRNGILSNVQKMQNAGQTLAQRFRDAFKNVLGIHSPSRVMMNDAKYIVEGLVIGLDDNAIDAIDAGQSMGSKVADAIADSVNMANMLADQELSISPLITPVVDMQSIDNAINTLNSDLSSRDVGFTANAVGSVYNKSNAQNETVSQRGSAPSTNVTYVQNNYSPKELSRIDIYRNTRNQLNGHYRTDQNPSAYRR